MPTDDTRVQPDEMATYLHDPSVRVVEVDVSPAKYREGHIPGAVLWDAYGDLRGPDYSVISDADLAALVRRSGIGPDTTVITYGYAAHLGYWLLRSCGHDRVRLMDGPRERWIDAGGTWSSETPAPLATDYDLPGQHRFITSTAEVAAAPAERPGILVDVRSEAEYTGRQFWPSGAPESKGRPGHIPGAIHLPIDALRTSEGAFRHDDELRGALEAVGIDSSSRVITYCTIGNRAAQAWYALSVLLGHEDVSVYYDSYVEWGMDPDSPVEP